MSETTEPEKRMAFIATKGTFTLADIPGSEMNEPKPSEESLDERIKVVAKLLWHSIFRLSGSMEETVGHNYDLNMKLAVRTVRSIAELARDLPCPATATVCEVPEEDDDVVGRSDEDADKPEPSRDALREDEIAFLDSIGRGKASLPNEPAPNSDQSPHLCSSCDYFGQRIPGNVERQCHNAENIDDAQRLIPARKNTIIYSRSKKTCERWKEAVWIIVNGEASGEPTEDAGDSNGETTPEPVAVEDITPGWYWLVATKQAGKEKAGTTELRYLAPGHTGKWGHYESDGLKMIFVQTALWYRAPSPEELMAMCGENAPCGCEPESRHCREKQGYIPAMCSQSDSSECNEASEKETRVFTSLAVDPESEFARGLTAGRIQGLAEGRVESAETLELRREVEWYKAESERSDIVFDELFHKIESLREKAERHDLTEKHREAISAAADILTKGEQTTFSVRHETGATLRSILNQTEPKTPVMDNWRRMIHQLYDWLQENYKGDGQEGSIVDASIALMERLQAENAQLKRESSALRLKIQQQASDVDRAIYAREILKPHVAVNEPYANDRHKVISDAWSMLNTGHLADWTPN